MLEQVLVGDGFQFCVGCLGLVRNVSLLFRLTTNLVWNAN